MKAFFKKTPPFHSLVIKSMQECGVQEEGFLLFIYNVRTAIKNKKVSRKRVRKKNSEFKSYV